MGILEGVSSYDELIKRVNLVYYVGLHDINIHPLNLYLLHSRKDVIVFNKISDIDGKFEAEIEQLEEDFYLLRYNRKWGDEIFKSYAYIIQHNKGWIIINDDKKQSPLLGLIRRLYPNVIFCSLNSNDILQLINGVLSAHRDSVIDIYFATAKRPGYSKDIKKEQTRTIYKHVELEQLQSLVDKSFYIDKVKFKVMHDKFIFDGMVSAQGGICAFNGGDFSIFLSGILLSILGKSFENFKFHSNRWYTSDEKIISKPIEFRLKQNLKLPELENLAEALQSINNISVDVVNAGNPILLAHAIDDRDGSVFDISAVNKSIFLTPVLETSGESLLKVGEHIRKKFMEFSVKDYYEERRENTYSQI